MIYSTYSMSQKKNTKYEDKAPFPKVHIPLPQVSTETKKMITAFFLLIISIILPFKYFIDFYVLFIIIGLFLMIKKGAVTGTYPVDPVFKFNWGAFFGTWIWGLFNKTYITLFEILLFFLHSNSVE